MTRESRVRLLSSARLSQPNSRRRMPDFSGGGPCSSAAFIAAPTRTAPRGRARARARRSRRATSGTSGRRVARVALEVALHHLAQQLALGLPRVRPLAGEHLEHHDAEREQIGARIDARRIEVLLGADVERRAEQCSFDVSLSSSSTFANPRSSSLTCSPRRRRHEVDVLGLEVAVDRRRGACSTASASRTWIAIRTTRSGSSGPSVLAQRVQLAALEPIHLDVRAAVLGGAGVVDADERRMAERRGLARLAHEPRRRARDPSRTACAGS